MAWNPDVRSRAGLVAGALLWMLSSQAFAALDLQPCRLPGLSREVQCGVLSRPLDPSVPSGTQIELHLAVIPAVGRHRLPDPVVLLAGGPGQSAVALAGQAQQLFSRLGLRRDILLLDQRGTGHSAPLVCPEGDGSVAAWTERAVVNRMLACRRALSKLPWGDLRWFTTSQAVGDLEAARSALGYPSLNLVGVSYGTRVGLAYARRHPERVRRLVLDSVVPPDMGFPAAMRMDHAAALASVVEGCRSDPDCHRQHPDLAGAWQRLLSAPVRKVEVRHPVTGEKDALEISPELLINLTRQAMYQPVLASALPMAITQADRGNLEPLLGLSLAMPAARGRGRLAEGMHFSVVCQEDMPAPGADVSSMAAASRAGDVYQQICADWPRAQVDPSFRTVLPAAFPTLLLSGASDPVTPPRHGERMKAALGDKARHLVAKETGHFVMSLPCVPGLVASFVAETADAEALTVVSAPDALKCLSSQPKPAVFVAPGMAR